MNAHAAKFAPNPKRRGMIATIQIAKKELRLDDDDYRRILRDVTGKASTTECNDVQLVLVIERFKSRGWRPAVAAGKASKPRSANHPVATKARALWISLHQLGVVENPAEEALVGFAARQLKVERLQWANQAQGYKLIEALKSIGTRAGWDMDLTGVATADKVYALQIRLITAILVKLKKLGHASPHWGIEEAAWQLCGLDRSMGAAAWDIAQLRLIAEKLGDVLRTARGATTVYRA